MSLGEAPPAQAGPAARSVCRRFGVCLLVLLAVDQAVPALLRRAEARHYESDAPLRFKSFDLFPLGPLTDYLREHPVGPMPRTGFFGNSVMWGYLLDGPQTISCAFARLAPEARVLDFSAAGFQGASSYLIAKRVVDDLDAFYIYIDKRTDHGDTHPLLPKVIAISEADAAAFGLKVAGPGRRALDRLAGVWKLRRDSYRLQAAWFGTSTQQAIRLWAEALFNRLKAPADRGAAVGVAPREQARWHAPADAAPISDEERARLAAAHPVVWRFAQLLAEHHRPGVFFQFAGPTQPIAEAELPAFNAAFDGITIATLTMPAGWYQDDGVHVTAKGAEGIARALRDHARLRRPD